MLRIEWTEPAIAEFIDAQRYIAQDNPVAARSVAKRIRDAARKLRSYPNIGRHGEDEGTREWMVDRTPYLLVYEVFDDRVEILRVWHTSRQRGEAQGEAGEPA
jgi:addiction module RelE/StbE family toxin